MTTTNHTDIAYGADGSSAVVNAPLGQLDAAIGDLSTLGTTPKSSVAAALGTSTPTTSAKTVTGAINELDGEVVVNTAAIGTLGSLTTTEKASVVGAINELDAEIGNLATLGGGISTYDHSVVEYIGTAILLTTAEKLAPAINEVWPMRGRHKRKLPQHAASTARWMVG